MSSVLDKKGNIDSSKVPKYITKRFLESLSPSEALKLEQYRALRRQVQSRASYKKWAQRNKEILAGMQKEDKIKLAKEMMDPNLDSEDDLSESDMDSGAEDEE